MNISVDITIASSIPEIKHIELCKHDETPWSFDVRELLRRKVISKKEYIDLKDDLEDLSWKENFVFEIHDGWGNLEA